MGWLRRLLRRPPLLHVARDAGDGPPVVLLHGIASSSVTFENVVPLITEYHRAVSIDLLGFGASPVPADATYTIEEHVAALHRTLRKLGLRRVVLVGHSMGALIAVPIALLTIVSDLIESALKRRADTKDTGALIPGIGGAFDLTDSLILSAPVAYFMFMFLE